MSTLSLSSIRGIIPHALLPFPPFFSHKILSPDLMIGSCLKRMIHYGSLTTISTDDSIPVTARAVTTMFVSWLIELRF